MLTYSSGCAPLVLRKGLSSKCDQVSVKRHTKSSAEWLVQRGYIISAAGQILPLMSEPRVLEDKTAWAHYQCYREFSVLPREMHVTGIIVHHQCYDRAIHSALTRRQQELHERRRIFEEQRDGVGASMMNALTSLFTSVACVNHDAHNGLEWAATQRFTVAPVSRFLFPPLDPKKCWRWCAYKHVEPL